MDAKINITEKLKVYLYNLHFCIVPLVDQITVLIRCFVVEVSMTGFF